MKYIKLFEDFTYMIKESEEVVIILDWEKY